MRILVLVICLFLYSEDLVDEDARDHLFGSVKFSRRHQRELYVGSIVRRSTRIN
jgi:hypothetical protein